MGFFAGKRRRSDTAQDAPAPQPEPAARPAGGELDDFARRQLEAVFEQADALAASLDAARVRPQARPARSPVPVHGRRRARPAPASAPTPAPPRQAAFEDAPTNPFIRLEAELPEPEQEPLDEHTPPLETAETHKVIVDERLLYGDPELSVKTAPFARVAWCPQEG